MEGVSPVLCLRTPAVKTKSQPPFQRETDLCLAFIEAIPKEWVAYPECNGWDILLSRKQDGFQIGIQAKLRLGIQVMNQAIEDRWGCIRDVGPDCRAILVPSGGNPHYSAICAYVGITVIQVAARIGHFTPHLPQIGRTHEHPTGRDWYELCPERRHKLPEYVPDVPAGASAPVQLTEWKIKALKIAVILEKRGIVTRSDFRTIGIDHRRWLAQDWLQPDGNGSWSAGAYLPDFKRQHPTVFEQIKADAPKWMPEAPLISARPVQEALL